MAFHIWFKHSIRALFHLHRKGPQRSWINPVSIRFPLSARWNTNFVCFHKLITHRESQKYKNLFKSHSATTKIFGTNTHTRTSGHIDQMKIWIIPKANRIFSEAWGCAEVNGPWGEGYVRRGGRGVRRGKGPITSLSTWS